MSRITAGPSTSSEVLGAGGPRPPHLAERTRRSGARLSNPLRIGQIGVDHIQVFIRPVHGDTELLALVDRLEQLIGAGYETVDVVLEGAPLASTVVAEELVRLRSSVTPDLDTVVPTDATAPPLQRS